MQSILRLSSFAQAATIAAVGVAASTSALAQTHTQITSQMRSEAQAVMQACRSDYDSLCTNVSPGGGRILACLQSHAGRLTPSCAKALPRAQALRDSAASAGVASK